MKLIENNIKKFKRILKTQ